MYHDNKNFGKFTTSVNFDTDFYRIPYMELVQSYSKAELDEVSSRSRVLRLLFFAMHKSIFRNLCVCYASMVMCGYPLCQKYSANLLSDLRIFWVGRNSRWRITRNNSKWILRKKNKIESIVILQLWMLIIHFFLVLT